MLCINEPSNRVCLITGQNKAGYFELFDAYSRAILLDKNPRSLSDGTRPIDQNIDFSIDESVVITDQYTTVKLCPPASIYTAIRKCINMPEYTNKVWEDEEMPVSVITHGHMIIYLPPDRLIISAWCNLNRNAGDPYDITATYVILDAYNRDWVDMQHVVCAARITLHKGRFLPTAQDREAKLRDVYSDFLSEQEHVRRRA